MSCCWPLMLYAFTPYGSWRVTSYKPGGELATLEAPQGSCKRPRSELDRSSEYSFPLNSPYSVPGKAQVSQSRKYIYLDNSKARLILKKLLC
jgi:hypothetical protein